MRFFIMINFLHHDFKEAGPRNCSLKVFLKYSQNVQENSSIRVSLNQNEGWSFQVCQFIKRDTPVQVFSCDFKNTFFVENLRTVASFVVILVQYLT